MTDALIGTSPSIGEKVAIAVVDADEAVRNVLIEHVRDLDDRAAAYDDIDGFAAASDPLQPTVLVMGPSQAPENAIPEAGHLVNVRPTVGVVMLVFDLAPGVLQQAIRAGVDDMVAVSAEDEELGDAITRVAARLQGRLPAAPPPPVAEVAPEQPSNLGKVISVFCTKGGVGKSVIAVNLAVTLAEKSDRPVVLVDADLQFGDAALMLQLQPQHTIAEAVAAGDRLDGALLGSLMLRHEASGLFVLAAPTEPGPADHIHGPDLARVLNVLREECAYIVVDTSANFGEITLSALQNADQILVVAGLDVMSLKSAKVGLQTMRVLGVPFGKILFVLNRANTQVGLTNTDAERALQLKVDVALPSDVVVAASVNKGVPVVTGVPRSKFARGIEELASKVAAPAAAAHKA
jgi:pilus assembly protein CpaE